MIILCIVYKHKMYLCSDLPCSQSRATLYYMEPKGPAAFKYQVAGSSNAGLVATLITSAIVSIIATANFGAWCLLGLLLPLGIAIHLIREGMRKTLIISPRYLIVGEQIVYYATVSKAIVDRHKQTLTLVSGKGKQVVIEADRFPTNARKDFKIKANKTAKFDKACEKVLSRLQGVTPEFIG